MKASLKKLLRTPMVVERFLSKDTFGNALFDFPITEVCAVTNKNSSSGDSSVRTQSMAGLGEDGKFTLITDSLGIVPGDRITFEGTVTYVRSAITYNDLKAIPQAQELTVDKETI